MGNLQSSDLRIGMRVSCSAYVASTLIITKVLDDLPGYCLVSPEDRPTLVFTRYFRHLRPEGYDWSKELEPRKHRKKKR